MDEYKPTTDEVRYVYKMGALPERSDEIKVTLEMGKEFDRWLQSVRAEAYRQGQEDALKAVEGIPRTVVLDGED